MSDWPTQRLGDLAVVVDCEHKTAPAADRGAEYGYSVGTPHIRGGRIDYGTAKRVSKETFEAWSRRAVLGKGDLILAREAPVGQVGRVNAELPTCLGQRTVLVRPRHEVVDERFLQAYLLGREAQKWMEDRSSGSTVAHLNVSDVREIPVRVPSISEQRRISALLGAFDDLIETNRQLASQLEDHASSVFTVFGFDAVPEDGKAVSLSSLVEINPRIPKPRGDAPYVDMAALPTDSSRIASVVRRPASGGARFQNGDTLLARLTPCLENGKAALVDVLDEDEIAVGSTEFIVLRDRSGVGSEWPYLLTRSDRFRDYAIQNMNGSSGRQRVSADDIGRYPLPAPDPGHLERFRRTAATAFAAIQDLNDEIGDLTRTRDELLPLLMSGQVCAEDVEVTV